MSTVLVKHRVIDGVKQKARPVVLRIVTFYNPDKVLVDTGDVFEITPRPGVLDGEPYDFVAII